MYADFPAPFMKEAFLVLSLTPIFFVTDTLAVGVGLEHCLPKNTVCGNSLTDQDAHTKKVKIIKHIGK